MLMTQHDEFRFQPGWAMPIVVDHGKPTLLSWFLGLLRNHPECLALRQGRCPGLEQCHDCTWTAQSSRTDP
jgi:hypothetical protein